MTDYPVFSRREFVQSGLVAVSTAATVPAFVHSAAVAMADPTDTPRTKDRPGVPQDRILVVVQLSGGNDGLNTVVPLGSSTYHDARPVLGIKEKDVLRLDGDAPVALQPAMADFKHLYDAGLASIVQGVGYPNPNRSHFASMDIWHTCAMSGAGGYGWLGLAMDEAAAEEKMAMIAIREATPLAGIGKRTRAVAFNNVNLFRWSGVELHDALAASYDKINRAGDITPGTSQMGGEASFLMRTALDAQVASDRIRAAVAAGPTSNFPNSPFADQLQKVAAMIRAELPTRVYYVGMTGFDTHAGQAGRHVGLLRQFSTAMRAFYEELKATGHADRVLSMAFSEFGRRVRQNASGGTDHGTAGPTFLFGPMIRPGLHGSMPSLTELDKGDLAYSTDFRSIYAAVLEQWLKVDSTKALRKAFKPAAVLDAKVMA